MNLRLAAIALALLSTACSAYSQVAVSVWQENLQGRVVYHYRLSNNANYGVLGLEIGVDQVRGGGLQLTVPPNGATFDEDLVPLDGIGVPLPSTSVTTPAGWAASLVGEEASPRTSVLFEVADTAVLRAGTHRGFSVTVPTSDDAYRNGGWKVILERGAVVWGTLAPDDTDAPSPTAAVSGSGTVCRGVPLTLSVAMSGNGPWSIQWSDGFVQTTSTSPASRSVTPQATTRYALAGVRDVNRDGATSGFADANILNPPLITTQPASKSVKKGSTTTLNVIATGVSPLSYQWYRGVTGTTSAPVGTNSATFTTPKITAPTSYWVRVTNSCGSLDSTTANLTLP